MMDLIRTSFTAEPATGPALARILLEQVASGGRVATLRLARTGPAVAFGRRDTVSPAYGEASSVAAELGHPGIERLSGGRATAYVGETLVLGVTLPDREAARHTLQRFDWVSGVVVSALDRLGLDASVGRLPGEYCPGDHSIILAGERKVAGLGQRMIAGAAHVGVVLTVSGGDRLREVLDPVYRALGLEWNPATAGALAEGQAGLGPESVEEALIEAFGQEVELLERDLDPGTLDLARERSADYLSPLSGPPTAPPRSGE
jgi:octanoyl-[GcvH]:protein N-octanoyltransferase